MSDFERLDVTEREEKAGQYVMGELGEGERRAFEAEMGESAELMQVVRELEEGATAVGLACPPRRVPPFMWERIERAVAEEERKVVPLFGIWGAVWRNAGWAAAACLAAWVFFGVYRGEMNSRNVEGGVVAGNANAAAAATNLSVVGNAVSDAQKVIERKNEVAAKEARERESERLRADVENLQRQMDSMSQMITQQQAMLGEPNRFKFLTLAPTANAAPINGLSPQLQRALFLAMARELGWLNASNDVMNGPFEDRSRGGGTNAMNVDFVDFRNTNGGPVRFKAEKETKERQTAESSGDGAGVQLASAVPAFATGDHVVMALDTTMAPAGSELIFSLNDGAQVHFLGSTLMGSNPTVVSFSSRGFGESGATLQVGVWSGGSSNLIDLAPVVIRAWNPSGGAALKAEPAP